MIVLVKTTKLKTDNNLELLWIVEHDKSIEAQSKPCRGPAREEERSRIRKDVPKDQIDNRIRWNCSQGFKHSQ